ncbi:hypothetical protein CCO03_05750 [Comamonas serinivorans]|uniref:DUF2970 domain-containing protein n=1 Tax=Comamonas serinivorans TaxID=1082851 RepID=A0A1Y0ELG9_9BURK|nr:hypothetical protein CCO03_05750 [Comamonas serinivorans]
MSDPRKSNSDAVSGDGRPPDNAKPSILRAFQTVAWSFLGIRKNSEFQRDLQSVNPLHIIAVGLVLLLLFIGVLLLIVKAVVA